MGRITDNDDSHHQHEIDNFIDWWDRNYLLLNVDNTMDMVIACRKNQVMPSPVIIKGAEDEWDLGIILDNVLRSRENIDAILKRAHRHLYCLRKFRFFGASFAPPADVLYIHHLKCCQVWFDLLWRKCVKEGQQQNRKTDQKGGQGWGGGYWEDQGAYTNRRLHSLIPLNYHQSPPWTTKSRPAEIKVELRNLPRLTSLPMRLLDEPV